MDDDISSTWGDQVLNAVQDHAGLISSQDAFEIFVSACGDFTLDRLRELNDNDIQRLEQPLASFSKPLVSPTPTWLGPWRTRCGVGPTASARSGVGLKGLSVNLGMASIKR